MSDFVPNTEPVVSSPSVGVLFNTANFDPVLTRSVVLTYIEPEPPKYITMNRTFSMTVELSSLYPTTNFGPVLTSTASLMPS